MLNETSKSCTSPPILQHARMSAQPGAPPLDPNLAPYAAWDPARQAAWGAAVQQYRYDNIAAWSTRVWVDGHTYTLEYPDAPNDAQRAAATTFFQRTISERIRCGHCRGHYDAAAAKVGEHTASRAALVAWFIRVHNLVNAKLGRPTLQPEEALRRYMSPSALGVALRTVLSAPPVAAAPAPTGSVPDVLGWGALVTLLVVLLSLIAWGVARWHSARPVARIAAPRRVAPHT